MRFRHHLLAFIIIAFALNSCKDKGNPVNGDKPNGENPPCPPFFPCPPNFRVTDVEPAWSPDGKLIAYVHGDAEPGRSGIYIIKPSGENKRLWYASAGVGSPSWSPDGEWIVFHDHAQIYKRKFNGDSLIQLTTEGRNFFPAWSPDPGGGAGGQWIAYDRSLADASGPGGVWIMKPHGTQKRFVFGGAFPAWHPNRQSLLAVIGTSPTSIWKRFVCYYPFQTVQPETLSAVVGNDNLYPNYSPDGTKIAFTSQPPNGWPQIWVMSADGTNLTQLTTAQGYTCDWSPDGEWIVYTDSRAINGRLWIMRKDGSEKHQLTFK